MDKYKDIPCADCEEKKRELEEVGIWVVMGCKPIKNKPGWCRIRYRRAD